MFDNFLDKRVEFFKMIKMKKKKNGILNVLLI